MDKLAGCKGGFPHSEITGSKGARASPVLIAACHVLHRLSSPRHPSEALMRLIVSQQNPCKGCEPPIRRTKAGPNSRHPGMRLYTCQTMMFSQVRPVTAEERRIRPFNSRCQTPLPGQARAERITSFPIARDMVEPDGIEPTTSCLQSTRSTN